MKIIDNIQILRAIAAILVVYFHSIVTLNLYNLSSSFFKSPYSHVWGASGVDIFFIISGFIMVVIQLRKKRNTKDFLKDRALRIIPLYWFLTLAFFSILFFLPFLFNEKILNYNDLFQSLFFISIFFDKEPLLYVGWSLEYEMVFYIFFGIALLFNNKYLIIFTSLMMIVLSILLNNSVVLEFLFGMIIGYFWSKNYIKINHHCSTLLILIGFLSLIIFNTIDQFRFIYWGIPSLLIFLGFLNLKPIKNNLLIKLGDASYSIYLVHMFILPVYFKIISLVGFNNFFMHEYVNVTLSVILSVFAGYLTHLIIEKPLNNLIFKVFKKTSTREKNQNEIKVS